jgi:hypothetical protein
MRLWILENDPREVIPEADIMITATTIRASKGKERALQMRAVEWPDVPEDRLWNRSKCHGYTTIPRTLPLVMNMIDALSKNKPAGRTYFGLWCRTYDESVVIIENPMSMAFEAGFSGERAVTTWRQRMEALRQLGFIDAKPGSSGDFHFVLLFNPHWVVWQLKPRLQAQAFMQLADRAVDIGATDFLEFKTVASEPPKKATHKGSKHGEAQP